MKSRGKREVRFFVSYARANKDLAPRLLRRLRQQLDASKRYKYTLWHDPQIIVGENWNAEIQKVLKKCDLGLLLISPAFLGSEYIKKKELPKFIGRGAKPMVPVLLQPVVFGRQDLKGLRSAQIFRLEGDNFKEPKAYGDCSGKHRDQFAQELFRQIELKLDKV
jgi:hypothetical protein